MRRGHGLRAASCVVQQRWHPYLLGAPNSTVPRSTSDTDDDRQIRTRVDVMLRAEAVRTRKPHPLTPHEVLVPCVVFQPQVHAVEGAVRAQPGHYPVHERLYSRAGRRFRANSSTSGTACLQWNDTLKKLHALLPRNYLVVSTKSTNARYSAGCTSRRSTCTALTLHCRSQRRGF